MQIVKIFKKYKLRNEASLDYFGYGYSEALSGMAGRRCQVEAMSRFAGVDPGRWAAHKRDFHAIPESG